MPRRGPRTAAPAELPAGPPAHLPANLPAHLLAQLPSRTIATGVLGVAAALTALGCGDGRRTIEGVQPLVQERRAIKPVDRVEVVASDGLNVRVLATAFPAEDESRDTVVWIEGAGDLMEYVLTTVHDSTLRISIAEDVRLSPVPDVEVRVADLRRLSATGAGVVRLEVEDGHVVPALGIEAMGSVQIEGVGAVRALDVDATGSGDVHLMSLDAVEAVYRRRGSGDGWISAVEHLRAEITGSGDLYLSGDPDRVVETTGSGRVRLVDVD